MRSPKIGFYALVGHRSLLCQTIQMIGIDS